MRGDQRRDKCGVDRHASQQRHRRGMQFSLAVGMIDDGGEEIFIRYRGDPTQERYTFIRDYLDFKLSRMKKFDL